MSMLLRALRGAPAISSLQPLRMENDDSFFFFSFDPPIQSHFHVEFCRFASKGAKKNGRDSNPKYLGVKVTQ